MTPLPPFPGSITQIAVQAATAVYPADYIVEHILKLSGYLIDLASNSNIFGRTGADPYSPSLSTLFVRLREKRLGPSRLPPGFLSPERIHARIHLRVSEEAASRPLADFEDLYYALLARIQDIYQLLNLRIESGFNIASHVVFDEGPSIAELHTSLTEYWNILNDAACGKALDDAIREARVQALRDEIAWQVENDNMSTEDAHAQLSQLYSADIYNGILGLNYIQDWVPAMVGAYLEQKYRHMFDLEKQEAAVKTRLERRQARMKPTRVASPPDTPEAQIHTGRHQARGVRRPCRESSLKARKQAHRRSKQLQEQSQLATIHNDMRPLSGSTASKKQSPIQSKDHDQPHEQASLHTSPSYQAQLHPGQHHEEHSAALYTPDTEQDRAYQADLEMFLDWHVKTQRVEEYSNYLRARASQSAQRVVQGTRAPADGSTGSRNEGDEFLHPDMDLSRFMEF
ncbi:hypothetical protein DDE82_000895 [Stemphylium lycopersici]|uniref:Uncharacterized protein n=1 Tax=Stemphylium lycopersici TaxID=183478 RepID=A0A364NEH4_STELY|nr:hypothetical protein TW65_05878 [Stemphylium lycopersici]RAR10923.1 hypothetical protein DDE82_000895 [Stemphylium lycopersici]RAR15666.1 hypothetical protein DDE83_000898 [Stemphylium lycopersici]